MLKEQKGITLVALIITIIVMLILAGVSISLVVGDNGVLTQAQNVEPAQEKGALKEAIALANTTFLTDYYTDTSANKADYIAEYSIDTANMTVDAEKIVDAIEDSTTSGRYDMLFTDRDGNDIADAGAGEYRVYLGTAGATPADFVRLLDADGNEVFVDIRIAIPVAGGNITGSIELTVDE